MLPRFHVRPVLRRLGALSAATVVTGTLALTVAPAPSAFAANASMEQQFVADMNQARASAGLAPYSVAWDLTSVARQHSDDMARQQQLYHNPNLQTDITNWQSCGENVGEGPTVSAIHNAFMNSPEHRANILDHGFTQVGVGVTVDSNGQIWVTEDFRQPMGGSTAAAQPAAPASSASPVTAAAPPVVAAARPTPTQQLGQRLAWVQKHTVPASHSTDPLAQAMNYARLMTVLAA
ncbi:MAG TPA: CAP domain-containing protein [Mycobacteriales bacterium]|nr:CAP domain-containing protein [Mycobacteriales bacterium]